MADDRPQVPGNETDASLEELGVEELEEVRPAPPRPPGATTPAGLRAPTGGKASPTARRTTNTNARAEVRALSEVSAKIAAVAQRASRLRLLCEAQLEAETDPARKARLHYELGRLAEVELGDSKKAAEHYQRAIALVPDFVSAIRGARRALASTGSFAALPALFDAEIAVTREPAGRARLLYSKARVMERRLGQPKPALLVDREALSLDPGNLTILKALERGHRRDEEWRDLVRTYGELAGAVSDPALWAAWTAVAAHVTETRLADPVQAAELYERALEADPRATDALAHVKRLGAAHGRWHSLVTALRKEHELCADVNVRQAILASIARVQEKRLGDVDAATKTIEEALRVRPEDRALLAELARLSTMQGQHPVGALARLAERTSAPDELASLCHRIGRIFEQDLGEVDRARPWYERALAADPTHRASASALFAMYEARQDWRELLRVLAIRASAVTTPSEQAELRCRMGHVLEVRLGQLADAAAQHEKALGLDPDHYDAFRALTRLWTAAGRWRELAQLYGRAVDRARHDAEAIGWLFRVGAVLEDRIGDVEGALATYERILARDPANLGALDAVARTAQRAGRFDRVVSALRAEAKLTPDATRKHALLHRAAALSADPLGDVAGACAALDAILREDPKHRPSLETLAQLKAAGGRWDELIAIHARLLPILPTSAERARLHLAMGEIKSAQLGDERGAITSFTEALALDPELEPARAARIAALGRANDFAGLASALEERLGRLRDKAEQARAATELGELYEERLGDRARALASYERAIEAVPLHRAALDARERLLTDAKKSQELADALQREHAASEDEFERVQAALRAALVATDQAGVHALAAFRPVFTAVPDHVGALVAVEGAYRAAEDGAGLAATYERMVAAVKDRRAQLAILAELAAARAGEGGDAAAIHRRILSLAPDDPTAIEELAAEAERQGDVETQLAMHAKLAAAARDTSVGVHHQQKIGELLLAKGDAAGALAAFGAALALDPQSLGATDGLTRAARAARDPAAIQHAARFETLVTRDRSAAVALLIEAAHLYFGADREDEAAVAYEEALSLAPDHPEAATGLMATMMRTDRIPRLVELLARAASIATDPGRVAVLHLCVALLSADLLQDLTGAVAATKRAIAARPGHPVAIASLATYLERNGQWVEAVETLEQMIGKASGEALLRLHLRVATIAEKHLRDPARAKSSLRIVLATDENHAEALTAMVRLERVTGNDEEALRLARKLITVVVDPVHRGAAFSELAELEKARGQIEDAANAAYWAIEIQGPQGAAAKLYRGLIASAPQHASWDNYITGLLSYIERGKAHGGNIPAGYRELARVFNHAQRPDRAIPALREGVVVCPDDASISLALVAALRQVNAEAEALAELRRLSSVDVCEVGAWRNLADVLARMGVPDGASCALAPLVVLGQASAEEGERVRARRPRPGAAPAMILAGSGLKQLLDGTALDEPPATFIPAVLEILTKLEGIDYERWGLNKRDRIRAGDVHPMRTLADRIGRMFGGVPEYDIFVGVSSVARPYVIAGSPPALLIPAGIDRLPEAAQVFHLARPLALLSRSLHPLDHIDDAGMEKLLVGVVRQFAPSFRLDPIYEEEELDVETRRVAKAIGFFSRSRIQEASVAFAEAPPRHYPAWAREIRRMAARAALLIADDLVATLEALGESLGPDNYASDLARFWVSDPAIRFRRAVAQLP